MGNVLRRKSENPQTPPKPPPIVVHTSDGHELEYLGTDRGLYCFRLLNYVQQGRYIGDCTRKLDAYCSEYGTGFFNKTPLVVYYYLTFGAQVKDPDILQYVSADLAMKANELSSLGVKLPSQAAYDFARRSEEDFKTIKRNFANQTVSLSEVLKGLAERKRFIDAQKALIVKNSPPPPEKKPSRFAKGNYIPMTNAHCPDDDDEEDDEDDRRNCHL